MPTKSGVQGQRQQEDHETVSLSGQKMAVSGAKIVREDKGWNPEIPKVCMKEAESCLWLLA